MSLCELLATGSPCTVRLSTVSVVDRVRPLYIRDLGSSISSRHDRPIFRVPNLQRTPAVCVFAHRPSTPKPYIRYVRSSSECW